MQVVSTLLKMNPPWQVNKTSNFNHCIDKERVSADVQEAIDRWAQEVKLEQTKNFRLCFVSPKRIFQVWNAKIADPDHRKGKRSGFRLVCFFLPNQGIIFLDMLERRNDLGGKTEHPRDQQKYTEYLKQLIKELMEAYENGNS